MKLALIGGGGVRTVFFCESLARYAAKTGITELRLMDTDREKLHIFGTLSRHAVKEICDLNIILTDSLEEAVTDVDYVVTAIREGQDAGRVKDERTALNLGVIGQETTGAGGFSYALRTIPVMKEYMEVIRQKSNNAVVFNFTNPAGLVTQALYDAGYDRTIGICDNATGIKINLAESLKINAADIFVKVYGLNHLTWADSVKIRGKEIFPQLMQNEEFIARYHDFLYYDRDLIRQVNALPNGYLYYYYHKEKALENIRRAPKTRGETILELNQRMMEIMRGIDIDKQPEKALQVYYDTMNHRNEAYMSIELGGETIVKPELDVQALGIPELDGNSKNPEVLEGYAGVALNYIEAVHSGKETDLALNVPNRGAIPFLEDDDIAEVTCIVNKDGASPVKMDNIPEANELLIRKIKLYEKRTVEAIKEKSMELGTMALMEHPLVNSYSLAKQLMNDYKSVHKDYLRDWK